MGLVERETRADGDPVDPLRAVLLGLCTMALAAAFALLLLADNASAVTF